MAFEELLTINIALELVGFNPIQFSASRQPILDLFDVWNWLLSGWRTV